MNAYTDAIACLMGILLVLAPFAFLCYLAVDMWRAGDRTFALAPVATLAIFSLILAGILTA